MTSGANGIVAFDANEGEGLAALPPTGAGRDLPSPPGTLGVTDVVAAPAREIIERLLWTRPRGM